jgi:hypothetical protein
MYAKVVELRQAFIAKCISAISLLRKNHMELRIGKFSYFSSMVK